MYGYTLQADDSVLAVGMSDGLLSIQHRKADTDVKLNTRARKKASYKYVLQKTHVPAQVRLYMYLLKYILTL